MSHKVNLHRYEIREPDRCTLAKDADCMVVPVGAKIRTENRPVRMRGHGTGHVHGVVPHQKFGGNGRPSLKVVHQQAVFLAVDGLHRAAFDHAELNQHIRTGTQCSGWFAGVLIGKGHDMEIRKLLLYSLGHLVYPVERGGGGRALRVVQCLTFGTLADGLVVVLTHMHHTQMRVLPDFHQDILRQLCQHLVIGHTELGIFSNSFAAALAVPFRVILEILFRRQERVKGVPPAHRHETAAQAGGQDRTGAVVAQASSEPGLGPVLYRGIRVVVPPCGSNVYHAPTVHFAKKERRLVADIQGTDRECRFLRHKLLRVRPPANADFTLQELVHSVERAAPGAFSTSQNKRETMIGRIRLNRLLYDAVLAQSLLS